MTRTLAMTHSLFLTACLAVPALAADDEALKKDLTSVIALHGLPCGEVISVTVQGQNDFAALCKDGNNRVYEANGRVLVEKRT